MMVDEMSIGERVMTDGTQWTLGGVSNANKGANWVRRAPAKGLGLRTARH